MRNSATLQAAIAGVLALGVLSATTAFAADDTRPGKVLRRQRRPAGTSCAAGGSACSGQSSVDNDPASWKYVAKGTCEKVGGKTMAPKT